jgi:cytochrome P450
MMTQPHLHLVRFKEIRKADKQLIDFMRVEIEERKAALGSPTSVGQQHVAQDIFTMLVRANENEDAKLKLTESELVCQVFKLVCNL